MMQNLRALLLLLPELEDAVHNRRIKLMGMMIRP